MTVHQVTLDYFLNEILIAQFDSNVYFKFTDFSEIANRLHSQGKLEADVIRDFIYKMIDANKIVQEYVGDGVNPMTPKEEKATAPNKSIRFKRLDH